VRVECGRCQRKGRCSVRKLIEKYGRNANMMKWKEQLNGDCPKRDAPQMHDSGREAASRDSKPAQGNKEAQRRDGELRGDTKIKNWG
jgi:hypothetical protein